MNNKKIIILFSIALILMCLVGYIWSNKKLTYLEYKTFNSTYDDWITLSSNDEAIKQEFSMPYNIVEGISILIGTFGRDNNSTWKFTLVEDKNEKVIYEEIFNASQLNNSYYKINFDQNQIVTVGEQYSFKICAIDVNESSGIAFGSSNESVVDEKMYFNCIQMPGDLCFRVYGGNTDYWWLGYILYIIGYICLVGIRIVYLKARNKHILDDIILQGLVLSGIYFLLRFSFSSTPSFTDECDNMRGGLIIANGGVLYRDYIVQHTPIAYYLCGIFALFGASSVEQFRLSFYIFEAIVWFAIYLRNANTFGRKATFILPFLETICISTILTPYGTMILSDEIQGIAFVALMFEYLRYLKDKEIGWDKSIIVSICIWASFGAAFVSVFSLVWVFIFVIIVEVKYWRKTYFKWKDFLNRYTPLLVSLLVPLSVAIIYFKANNSLDCAFDQIFTFNIDVYPNYQIFGNRFVYPFISGIQNFFSIIANNFASIINAETNNIALLQFVIMILAVALLMKLFIKKQLFEGLGLLLVMAYAATRGYDFHGMAAWYIAIMIIVLYNELLIEMMPKIGRPAVIVIAIILFSQYICSVGNNLLAEQSSVSELESEVIALTENEDNKDIFLDAYFCDSLYFFYKNRKTINPVHYMLPWYMDWYEKDNIAALKESMPKVVVYNIDRECWGISHYTVAFDEELKAYYTRLGDANSGWKYYVWTKNDDD